MSLCIVSRMVCVCLYACVAVDEEPEQEDIIAEDTSGSEARNETGISIQQVEQDNLETDLYSAL